MALETKKISDKINSLPNLPGIYQFLDNKKQIIYIGKAKDLKKRVKSYFSKNNKSFKTSIMISHIDDVLITIVNSENDAFLLERSLIRENQPRFNIQLKDGKTYPWICIKKEPFPRVFMTRRVIKDGSLYYGPYSNVNMMHTLLNLIKDIYSIRNCTLDLSNSKIKSGKYKECLEFHIGNCKAPCVGKQEESSYQEEISEIKDILNGNLNKVKQIMQMKMRKASEKENFESAQRYKENFESLKSYQSKSIVVSSKIREVDVLTYKKEEKNLYYNYLLIRNGAIVHTLTGEADFFDTAKPETILKGLLYELRGRYESKSKEVITEKGKIFLSEEFLFHHPQKGEKKKLLDLSLKNVQHFLLLQKKKKINATKEKSGEELLEHLKKDLSLKKKPKHMECFDNSNFQGTNAVSACVVFKNAKPSKKDYRHFNIKTVSGPDDFASMREVVFRRYKRLIKEKESIPDLVLIDGGKGQLSAAYSAIKELNLDNKMIVLGIAKREEELFFAGNSTPLLLNKNSASLKTLQFMRDEAHRFGITHHRKKRNKLTKTSLLDQAPGIGPKLKEKLYLSFKTIERIKNADLIELEKVIGEKKAFVLKDFLKID
ncbi:MAG: excinuclease ABC subunit UvrC [Crocinitomicaceae bacterium]|nr:excinuclease ABC subunit UvrC [Crocinitomicaceae bacterium]